MHGTANIIQITRVVYLASVGTRTQHDYQRQFTPGQDIAATFHVTTAAFPVKSISKQHHVKNGLETSKENKQPHH
eukprot:4265302-Amphidinium_carterae.1